MNIKEQLARVKFFDVKQDLSSLRENERKAIEHCIRAGKIVDTIYLHQVAPGNYELYKALEARSDEAGQDLFRYFSIHGGPWDSYNHDESFMPGVGPKPKSAAFYPQDFRKDEWDHWLAVCPQDRDEFEGNYTIIERERGGLIAVQYSVAYSELLQEAAKELKAAAGYLPEGNLKTFLNMRAEAFLSNNYFDSDMTWVDTDGNPFEVTIGPYEVYIDELLGLKAAFQGFVALPDKDATNALTKFSPFVPEFDGILSQEFGFKPKGAAIPLEVVADVYRGGFGVRGFVFSAFNLPNDRRIHELKGSKKVFSRTMMEASFKGVGL